MSDHKAEEIKGRVKEAAGDLTGDRKLKREGQVDQGSAAVKTKIDEAASKLKDAASPHR
jgi:uncharacterized protein YjbJ (UPF0337 family)